MLWHLWPHWWQMMFCLPCDWTWVIKCPHWTSPNQNRYMVFFMATFSGDVQYSQNGRVPNPCWMGFQNNIPATAPRHPRHLPCPRSPRPCPPAAHRRTCWAPRRLKHCGWCPPWGRDAMGYLKQWILWDNKHIVGNFTGHILFCFFWWI